MSRQLPRRVAVSLAGLVLVLTGITACGTSGPQATTSSGAGATIHVWVLEDAINPVQEAAAVEFNKTSPVRVVVDKVGSNGYLDKVRVSMGTPNAPDVFWNWGGGSIVDYVNAGQLVDLGSLLDADAAFKSSFLPSVLDAGKVNGRYYGIPLRGMQPVVLFYNKTVFGAHHVQPPSTWADLLAVVETFKAAKVTPFALAGNQSWTELMWLEYLLDRLGGPRVFADIVSGKAGAWQDPAVLKAAQTIRDLVDRGAFGTNYASVDYGAGGASTLFARGRAAMHLMGTWEFANQLGSEPDFAKSGLGYVAFPSVTGGSGDPKAVVGNPTNYFSLNAASKNTDAAIAFLKTLSSPSYVSALLAAGDVPTTSTAGNLLSRNPNPDFAAFQYQLVRDAPSFTLSWDQALTPAGGQTVVTNLQKLFNKQLTPEQFVSTVGNAK
jgi:xylobiose transport system substrate-binding protein